MTNIKFEDYPEFKPNLTPYQIMKLGSFGGTYFRPIHSRITNKNYQNVHLKYKWHLPDHMVIAPYDKYDKNINKYKIKVGETLEFWEDHDWIKSQDPYGWFQWYCEFYNGRRTKDDERQIKRWLGVAGPKGRFRTRLINYIHKKKSSYDDYKISPAIRQTLQHWGYKLSKRDTNFS
jgi:hypothetical protein